MQLPTDPPIITTSHPSVHAVEDAVHARTAAMRFDGIAIALAAVGLVALSHFVSSILSPFVVLAAIFLLLAPFRHYTAVRSIMWTSGFLFALWFLIETSGILVPFIIGGVIAYLFNPLVTRLELRYKISRTWSALITVLSIVGVCTLLGILLIPTLIEQTGAFIAKLSAYVTLHANTLDEKHLKNLLIRLGAPRSTVDQLVTAQITPQIKEMIAKIPGIIFGFLSQIPSYIERLLDLIIVPFAAFYFLKDWPKIGALFFQLLPAHHRTRPREVVQNIDRVLYGYVRGQITMAAIIGLLGGISFWILGVPYYGLLGVIIGLMDLVPIIGTLFAALIVEVVIVLTMELSPGVILSGLLVIGGLHTLEAYILGPRIVGRGIGIPPILMILSLLIFGYFLGFVGLLIAVPSTGVIMLFINEYRKLQQESEETDG
jgi:predicted PurR-regulated permease PerM